MRNDALFGFLGGLAAGALLGVLFAPDKGEETRKKIASAAEEGYGVAKNKSTAAYRLARMKSKDMSKKLDSLKDSLLEHGSEMKDDARRILLGKIEKLEDALEEYGEAEIDVLAENEES